MPPTDSAANPSPDPSGASALKGERTRSARWGLGVWLRFRERHLFDYRPSATAFWLALNGCGLFALSWHLWQTLQADLSVIGATVAAVVLSALASRFAMQLPRSAGAISAADIFIFGALINVSPSAAVLAAGIEGWVGTRRTSKRLSSWLASPAAAMVWMSVCGALFSRVEAGAGSVGAPAGAASFLALMMVALVPFVGTVTTLSALMSLKRGAPLQPAQWISDSGWMGAMYLGSAFVAGLVYLVALHYGNIVLSSSIVAMFALVWMLRTSISRQESERQEQEARISVAQREAELNQQRFTAAFTHAAIGMAVVRPDGQLLQVNTALCSLLRAEPQELLSRRFVDLIHGEDVATFVGRIDELLAQSVSSVSTELRVQRSDGDETWASLHCAHYDDPSGGAQCLIFQVQDITSRRVAELRLNHIAFHDVLTDLANRHCFQERLAQAVERTRTDARQRFAVVFMDLDRFKMVNDSFGHHAGNELLCTTAQRLRQCVRPGDLVARLGGDEFAVLLEDLRDAASGIGMAQRLLDTLSQPVTICSTEVLPAASVGITFSDLGYRSVDELLRDADLAMYEAKAAGRGRVAVFDQHMLDKVAQKLALESDLRHAIGEGQLHLNFQPLFELRPHRIIGFEALARWVHPERGPISPAVFVELAEESGHVEALTDWVIEAAVKQLALWQRTDPSLSMNVNISGRDLGRPSLVSHVRAVLSRYGVRAGSLMIEITESTLMSKIDVALAAMQELRSDGVRFSIDDFGTGYSSLAYLSRLPIDALKIDRSFVTALHGGEQNLEIVRAILQLGRSLGRRVVAEGIETTEQLTTLRDMGVDVGQGYLLSKPLSADRIAVLLSIEASVVV